MIKFRPQITVQNEEWTPEDTSNMREIVAHPYFASVLKTLNRRMCLRNDELIGGKETRPQIQEIADILLELKHYADPL